MFSALIQHFSNAMSAESADLGLWGPRSLGCGVWEVFSASDEAAILCD